MNTTEKERWNKIIQNHIPCTCGEIYLSRNLTAPDCPYHANDWESPMEEFIKELKEEPKGLRWVKGIPENEDEVCGIYDDGIEKPSSVEKVWYNHELKKWEYDGTEGEILITHYMLLPPAPSEEAAQNIKPYVD